MSNNQQPMYRMFAGAAAVLVLSAGAFTADWPQIGFDANRSGFNPDEHTLGPSNVGELETALEAPLDRPHLDTQDALKAVLRNALQALAAGQGPRQHLGVEQSSPDIAALCGKDAAAGDPH